MNPECLYNRLSEIQGDMSAMVGNPAGIAAYWTIALGKTADLAEELVESTPGHPSADYRLFANHAVEVLQGASQVLALVCNSDQEAEVLNSFRLIGFAIDGLVHTLEQYFIPETAVQPE
mgnify:CR=1 FL=1